VRFMQGARHLSVPVLDRAGERGWVHPRNEHQTQHGIPSSAVNHSAHDWTAAPSKVEYARVQNDLRMLADDCAFTAVSLEQLSAEGSLPFPLAHLGYGELLQGTVIPRQCSAFALRSASAKPSLALGLGIEAGELAEALGTDGWIPSSA